MQLTKQQFSELSLDAQEAFLNEGGSLVTVVSSDTKSDSLASPLSVDSPLKPVSSVCSGEDKGIEPPSQPTSLSSSPEQINYDGFLIDNPVSLLLLLDDNIATGRVKLHKWQIRCMLDFASGGFDDKNPYQAIVRACNGSGKDKFIIAPCVVWLSMRYRKTISVVTSASGTQLDVQTCRYIKALCESANRVFGPVWECKYRQYTIMFDPEQKDHNSHIFCYATDEPGKAEGYHPADFQAKMAIFVSEDKSVSDEINVALNKCTGYTHRVHVSTPGLPIGHFFDYCQIAVDRKAIKSLSELKPTDWVQYHVRGSDCNHLSTNYFTQMERDLPGGKFGSAYQSQVEAEFGTGEEMVVIPYTYVWRAINSINIQWIIEDHNTGGLDLSDGVAETCLTVRNGNKHLKTIPFKFDNTEDTIIYLQKLFEDNGLKHNKALIYADCVGMGKPILDRLKRLGWTNIRYIDSRAKALRPTTYRNRATELWFVTRRLLERSEIIVQRDDILQRQLSTRYYKLTDGSIHQVLSKQEQRSKGYPSPDRADSFNLAFWNYDSPFVDVPADLKDEQKPFLPEEEKKEYKGAFDLRAYAQDKPKKWSANNGQKDFSLIQEELEEYNKRVIAGKQ